MLEYLGNAIIKFIEKELADAAPEIEKLVLEQLSKLVDAISCYLNDKSCGLIASPDAEGGNDSLPKE